MDIKNIITEINDADDKRSVILKVENEISKLQPFNHKKSDIQNNYSIDNNSAKYRAEFYKDGKFCGMIILNFLK